MRSARAAFVLMPFADPYNSYYKSIFVPALREAGYTASRADDLFASRPIMEDIVNSIKKADLILCEMSGKNPNVFYELGLAHSLGKPVILVSQSQEDIPFDLRHIRIILYNFSDTKWASKLKRHIVAAAREIQHCPEPVWPPPLVPALPNSLHRHIGILRGRPATVQLLGDITASAREGDTLFGSCNTCADYPPRFYEELPKAVARGVKILFVAQDRPDSEGFVQRIVATMRSEHPKQVRILRSQTVYLRLFGIAEREALLAIPLDDEFIGLHFREKRVAAFLKLAFDEIVAKSKEVS